MSEQDQPAASRVGGRRRLFVCFLGAVLWALTLWHPQRLDRPPPIPTPPRERVEPRYTNLTPVEMAAEAQRKVVLGRPNSFAQVERVVEKVAPLVQAASERPELYPHWRGLAVLTRRTVEDLRTELCAAQEADLLLESGGSFEAVSSAGAVGVAQWIPSTARQRGRLHVDLREYARVVAEQKRWRVVRDGLSRRPATWKLAASLSRELGSEQPLGRDAARDAIDDHLARLEEKRLAADERRDPAKAIAAQTRYLLYLWNKFGRLDWAFQAYHGGEAAVTKTVRYFLGEQWHRHRNVRDAILGIAGYSSNPHPIRRPLSFARFYLATSPRSHPRAFRYVYNKSDDHRHYYFKLLMAQNGIARYRHSREEFIAHWQWLRPGQRLELAWWPPSTRKHYQTEQDVREGLARGKLLAIPKSGRGYGVDDEVAGPPALVPAAYGALVQIGRALDGFSSRLRFEVESLLDPGSSSADPHDLHDTGVCFDLARPRGRDDRLLMEYALQTISDRLLVKVDVERRRGRLCYHVAANRLLESELLAPSAPP